MRLAHKIAVITGAGSGIGRASAILFAKEGAKVVVADINDAGGEETVAAIKRLFMSTLMSRKPLTLKTWSRQPRISLAKSTYSLTMPVHR